MLSAAVVAVKSLPSEQVTPWARVSVTVVPSTFQAVASCDWISPVSASTETRVSYASWLTANSWLLAEDCGSSLPGSPAIAMVNVPPSTNLLSPPPPPPLDLLPSSPPPHAARRAAVAQTLRAAFSFMNGSLLSCSAGCRGSGTGAPDGAAEVEVKGVAVPVFAEEHVWDVHPLLGLEVDQAVAAEVHELVLLRLLAELLEEPLRRLLEPDPAVLVLADHQVGDLGRVGPDEPARVDLLGARRRCRQPGQRSVGQLREHVADDFVVEREGVAAVGEQRHGDPGLGHHAQEGVLSDGAAVVADEGAGGCVEPLEAEAPRVAHDSQVGHVDLARLHPGRGAGGEHLGAIGGLAVVEVHGGELEQVARTHGEHRSGGCVRARQRPDRRGLEAGARLELDVAH